MFPYDEMDFEPPAPLAETKVLAPGRDSPIQTVKMQLDSGSDMTCVPKKVTSRLRTLDYGSVVAVDFGGHQSTYRTVFISFSFAGFDFKNIEALEIEGDFGLFGRDVLNKLMLSLDGPNLKWSAKQ